MRVASLAQAKNWFILGFPTASNSGTSLIGPSKPAALKWRFSESSAESRGK